MAGVAVRMMVTFGLPSVIEGKEATTMDAVDRGATRSVADQLKIQHGFDRAGAIAQMASALGSLCCGERTRRLSVGQTLEVYREFERAIVYCCEHRPKHHGLRQIGFWAGFAFALATEDGFWERATPVSGWLAGFATGENLAAGSPVARLREFAMGEEAKLFARTMNRGIAELTLQAVWLQSRGETAVALEVKQDGADYFRGLQAERVKKVAGIFQLPGAAPVEAARKDSMPPAAPVEAAGPAAAAAVPAAARPSLDKIIRKAEVHFGIDRRILMRSRAKEDSIVGPRGCVFRFAVEEGQMKAEGIAAEIEFVKGQVVGELGRFLEQSKNEKSRAARRYRAFCNKF